MKYMTHLFSRKWALPERIRNRWASENLYLICIFSELVSKLRVYTDDLGPRATQCMASSPILGPWRPDAWTRKIRFPQLVRNSFKTAISDYDFDIFCPEATHGSFCPFLGTFEEAASEGLGLYLYVCSCMFVFVCLYLYVYICIYKLMYKIYRNVCIITSTKISS